MSKNDEICIKNEGLCIKNEEFCIQNDEFCRTIAAGTVLVHRARLRHRGLWNTKHVNRFMLQLNVAPLTGWQDVFMEKTSHARGLWGEIHAGRRQGFEERVVEARREAAAAAREEL